MTKEDSREPEGRANRKERWQKPTNNFIKLNSDGAFDERSKEAGWGFVIRDADGDVVSAGRGSLKRAVNAFHAELVACLHGVVEAEKKGITRIIIETDAMMVKQAIETRAFDNGVMGGLIKHLHTYIMMNFTNLQVVFSPRECNSVAHALAASGKSMQDREVEFLASMPACFSVLVARDLAAPSG
ncbi:hypothetical protein ACP70R_042409 [Stipagrostis hirtigluma subsp. patula]